ncbi:MAG: aldehyde dehydrogenase [Clostridia bacterium]
MDYQSVIAKQAEFFASGATKSLAFRRSSLIKLRDQIILMEDKIKSAIYADLSKGSKDCYMTEMGLVLGEIRYMLKHLNKLARIKRVPTPLAQFPAKSYIYPQPYGQVLIMSPWNYPFMLTIEPLVSVIASGNTAVIKPSNYSANTSALIKELIESIFPPEFVAVTTGGREVNSALLEQKWDYIFFTGSKSVGKLVMEKASVNLTPVTLELGGKSPCIVDKTANIELTARRISWGKFINAGQTCVAPDYILVDKTIKDKFIERCKYYIELFYGQKPIDNPNLCKIINDKHYERLIGLINPQKVVYGGYGEPTKRKICPTIMDNVSIQDAVMQEEIFGPIMPIIPFDNIEEIYKIIEQNTHPLALYLFSCDKNTQKQVLSRVAFGGGCINDTIVHLSTDHLAFGGVGQSGMGSYHGKAGFDLFTHYKSILNKKNYLDITIRYPNKDSMTKGEKIIKKLL